jgi:hypothetical protein
MLVTMAGIGITQGDRVKLLIEKKQLSQEYVILLYILQGARVYFTYKVINSTPGMLYEQTSNFESACCSCPLLQRGPR